MSVCTGWVTERHGHGYSGSRSLTLLWRNRPAIVRPTDFLCLNLINGMFWQLHVHLVFMVVNGRAIPHLTSLNNRYLENGNFWVKTSWISCWAHELRNKFYLQNFFLWCTGNEILASNAWCWVFVGKQNDKGLYSWDIQWKKLFVQIADACLWCLKICRIYSSRFNLSWIIVVFTC